MLGRPVRKSTGTTDHEAASAIRLATENELSTRALKGDAAVATFAEAVNDYIDHGGKERSEYIRPLVAYFGRTLLSEIDQAAVQRYVNEHCQGCGPFTINRKVYTPIVAIMRLAAFNKKCGLPVFRRPKGKKKLVKHAPDEWVNDFLVNCSIPKLRAIVWLMTTTGCRVTEAVNLRWVHVNFELKRALIETTKNDEPRSAPLDDDLLPLLKEMFLQSGGHGRVFQYGHYTSVNIAIRRECKRRGIPYYSSHKLGRHAIATRMLNAGHTCKEVADAVGWKQVRLVSENYGHLEQTKVQAAMLGVSRGIGKAKVA